MSPPVKPELRIVPKPPVSCPPQHRVEMRREFARKLRAQGVVFAALSELAGDLGDSSTAVDLAGIVQRCNRLAARVEPDDVG